MKRALLIFLVILAIQAMLHVPTEVIASRYGGNGIVEPVRLPRLFNVPTAGVLGSLHVYLTGGGAFGADKERYFLGRGGIGLGDVAEVEISTWAVINTLQKSSSDFLSLRSQLESLTWVRVGQADASTRDLEPCR